MRGINVDDEIYYVQHTFKTNMEVFVFSVLFILFNFFKSILCAVLMHYAFN